MKIRIYLDEPISEAQFEKLFRFLLASNITVEHSTLFLVGPHAQIAIPDHEHFEVSIEPDPADIDLEIAFLTEARAHNAALIKNSQIPKLLVGIHGLPDPLDRVVVPFEGKGIRAEWLRGLLARAHHFGWQIQLLYCDHGLVTQEIRKFADWFQLDGVKTALKDWLSDDVTRELKDIIVDYPELKVRTGVGRLPKLLSSEDPSKILLMGHLTSGYHLPNRHHGLNYSKLLTYSGCSGYFLAGQL